VVAAVLAAAGVSCGRPRQAEEPLRVAAAADLAKAFEEVGRAFEARTGRTVTLTLGSSGLLARQIAEGAPFDVYASANASFVDDVVKAGACFGDTRAMYARGRIVVWTRQDVPPPASLADLADGRFKQVAIANPEHAPYGRAAQQALSSLGLWDTVKPKLVYGENVQQALQFAQSGNADAALVALSLALVSDGNRVDVAAELHQPLDQALVVCKGSGRRDAATGFATFVGSDEGRAIMRRYGFLLPGEPGQNP
jgi:molybdate transport system substrate-binding protein